jgi:hypothetical protein
MNIKKVLKYFAISISLISGVLASAKPIPKTDIKKVLNAGKTTYVAAPVKLQAGLYIVGEESGDAAKVTGSHYLLIDNYINNSDQFIGVMIDQEAIDQGSPKTAFIFKSSTVRNGQTIILCPLIVDIYGNLAIECELNRNSPYLEISLQSSESSHRYPYLIQGRNGLLNDHVMGMRKSGEQLPNWKNWPSTGVYETARANSQIVVSGQMLSIHNQGQISESYALTAINGDEGGKLAGLAESSFDTMSETDITSSEFNRLAFFLQDFSQTNVFVIATPMLFPGRYSIKVFTPEKRSFMDIFFPGLN